MSANEGAVRAQAAPTVLFVLPWSPDQPGGVNEVVANLYRWVDANSSGRARLLVNSYQDGGMAQALSRVVGTYDTAYFPSPMGAGNIFKYRLSFFLRLVPTAFRLARYLRRSNVVTINVHYPNTAIVALVLARRLARRNIRLVLSFHGLDVVAAKTTNRGFLQRLVWRFLISNCDAVVACSNALGQDIKQIFPRVEGKLHTVHNGVDGAHCRREATLHPLPTALSGKHYIASVGTFEHKKGHDVLLAAFRVLVSEFPDIHLAIAGREGPAFQATQELTREMGLQERVVILPMLPHGEALALIHGAKLFVLPSRAEPFGIVLIEAGSLGTPVIATRVGGIPEIIADQRSGILVTSDAPEALSQAIRKMLQAPETAKSYASNLRAEVDGRFLWRHATARYAGILGLS